MTDEELKNLIASNAKAIEALTHALTQEREERQKKEIAWEKDRKGVYELLGRVARGQSDFYATQSDFYNRIEALTHALTQEREERQKKEIAWEKDRKGVYELLGRVARGQSDFYATQSDFYNRFDQIDERQAKITEILNRYLPPESLS